jgi:glycosyltransferase involved in cell wall biosynthesis
MRKAPFEIVFEEVNDPAVSEDTVTAAVSLYNYAEFLPETLDSIRAQRHPPLDLIVVDDASTEESSVRVARDWLTAHAGRFGRASLLRHLRNQGLAEARNTAFGYARSDLVFVIDADDLIYPRAIGRLVQAIRDTGFGAAYTQLEFFGSEHRLGDADVFNKEWLRTGNYIDATSLVSKRAWQAVGGYTHIEGGWEDYDFWCKFVEQGISAAYVPEILCRYRQHPKSMMKTETSAADKALRVQITLRHPWLELPG